MGEMAARPTGPAGGRKWRSLRAACFGTAVALLALANGCIIRSPPEPPPRARPPAVATRFARLSHDEWANTLRDLFALEGATAEQLAADLRLDPKQGGFLFDNYAASLSVDDALWELPESRLREWGEAGRARVVGITWDHVIDVLTEGLR